MTPDRWQHIQEVYFNAVALAEPERTPFLEKACSEDVDMRREVESLLQCQEKAGGFLEDTALDALVQTYGVDASERTDAHEDFLGTVIDDRYIVTKYIGSGGMGDVYRADHRLMATPVAIKRLGESLRGQKKYRQQFVEEARRAVQLDHDNIARVKDVVEEGHEVFVVMEFIDGQTLNRRLDEVFELDDFLSIATQCASALAAAHRARIVHLDIKPENIMLTNAQKVKICDFGLARQLGLDNGEPQPDTPWTFAGTPSYMAPEVLESNRFDGRADVFSLGVVFYQMLSGRHPFRAEDVRATTNRILNEPTPPLNDAGRKLPDRLTRLVEQMLVKQPARRPDSAEVLHELELIGRHSRFLTDTWKSSRELAVQVARKPIALVALSAALVAAVSLAYFQPASTARDVPPFPDKKYVAVLPFRVLGDNPSDRLYAEGVTEMLTDRLMQITAVPNLQIASSNLMRTNKVDTVARAYGDLGASVVVEGSFQFSGNKASYSYSLIRASDGQVLRAPIQKTVSFEDQFVFQDTVIKDVAARLEIALAPEPGVGTSNKQALALYTEGVGALAHPDDIESVGIAIDRFAGAIALDGQYAAAHTGLGLAYLQRLVSEKDQLTLLERASKACNQAIEFDPKRSDTQVCLGRVHEQQGDYELAIGCYRRAIEYSAANDSAFISLGSVLEKTNRFEDAEKAYLWAIELRPEDWTPHSWIGSFYNSRHQFSKAMEQYSAALNLSQGNGRVSYSIGNTYLNLGLYELAIQSFEDASRRRPYEAPPWSNLGMTYLRWRKYSDAIGPLEHAVELNDKADHRVTGNLGRIYWLTGQQDKARQQYDIAVQQAIKSLGINPIDPEIHILVGRYLAMLGRKAEAISHLNEAFRGRPNDPHYSLIAATAYAVMGNKAKALALTEKAVELGYTSAQILGEPELDVLKSEPRFMAMLQLDGPGK